MGDTFRILNLNVNESKNVLLRQKKSKENDERTRNESMSSMDSSHSLIVNKLFETAFDKLLRTKNYQTVGYKPIQKPQYNSSVEVEDILEENVQEKKKQFKKKKGATIENTKEKRNAKWLSESINNSFEIEKVNPNNEASNLILIKSSDEHELSKNRININRVLPSSTPFVKSYKWNFVNESLSPISTKHVVMKKIVFEQSFCSVDITPDEPSEILENVDDNNQKSKLDMMPYIKIERLPEDIVTRKKSSIKVDDQLIHIQPPVKSVPLHDFENFACNLMQCTSKLDIQEDGNSLTKEKQIANNEASAISGIDSYDSTFATTSGMITGSNESSMEIPNKKGKFCKSLKNKLFRKRERLLKQLENSLEWNIAKESKKRQTDIENCSESSDQKNVCDSRTVDCCGDSPSTSEMYIDNKETMEFPRKRRKYTSRKNNITFHRKRRSRSSLSKYERDGNYINYTKNLISSANYVRKQSSRITSKRELALETNIEIENNTGEELKIEEKESILTDTITSSISNNISMNIDEDVEIKSEFCETPTVVENCDDILDTYKNDSFYKKDKFVVTRRKRIYNISMKNDDSYKIKDESLTNVINMSNSVHNMNNISESGLPKDRFVFTRRRNGTAMPIPINISNPDDTNQSIDVEATAPSNNTINISGDEDRSNVNAVTVDDSSVFVVEQTTSLSNITDSLQTSEVNNTDVNNSEMDNKVDTFLIPKRFKIKPGKSWRRSMAFLKRTSIAVNLSSNISNENVLGSFSLRKQLLDLSVCRQSVIKFIPKSPKTSEATGSSQDDGYVPNNKTTNASVVHPSVANSKPFTEETALDQLLQLSVRHSKRFSLHPRLEFISARDLVLRRCEQNQPIPFAECFPDSLLKNCHKIGEGVYGEVFLFRNKNAGTSVMKIIPIQGDQIVNGERQKKYEEIISEIVIAQELSDLRNSKKNSTSCFNEVYKIHCVKGKYPNRLLDLWDLYEESKGSDNDCPDIFGEDQLYIVLELANGGQDLESFVFKNAQHAFSVFKQIAFSLAVAETSLQFEHRDLHWGNVLISNTRHPKGLIFFNLNGRQISMRSYSIQASIIDFTLSRITNDDICIFNDLSQDPDLFNAEGDYQFEIYRLMQKCNGNDWQQYKPYTNVLWLHYILDKMIHMVRYKSTTDKVHEEHIERMKDLKDELFEFKSAEEFVIKNLM